MAQDSLSAAEVGVSGRGAGVTAITAILNLNDHGFDFNHLKYPAYNRHIPPGFFEYPWGTTAPINWGPDPNGLIKFGSLGTMWQDSTSPGLVRYKAGGNPLNESDGRVIYTRDGAWQGFEQYLILGVKGSQVTTLKSAVGWRDLFPQIAEKFMSALNGLKPQEYQAMANNPGAVHGFVNNLREANAAGYMADINQKDVDAISSISYESFQDELKKLPEDERRAVESGKANNKTVEIVRKVLGALKIVVGGIATVAAIILAASALASAGLGPPGWVLSAALAAKLTAVVAVGGAVLVFLELVDWFLGLFFSNAEAAALLEGVPV
jgi:hypothetical protein